MKKLLLVVVILLVLGRIVTMQHSSADATPVAPVSAVPAVKPPQGVECTTLVDVDDYYDAVCKNTLGFDTYYTRTSMGSGGSSLLRISKATYEEELTWKSCIDEADMTYAKNFDARLAAHEKCREVKP